MSQVVIPSNLIERHRVVDEAMLAQIITHIRSGSTVIEIVAVYPLARKNVYRWLKKMGTTTEELQRVEIKPVQRFSYSYYINNEYKKGRIDRRQKNRIMSNFYAHREEYVNEINLDIRL